MQFVGRALAVLRRCVLGTGSARRRSSGRDDRRLERGSGAMREPQWPGGEAIGREPRLPNAFDEEFTRLLREVDAFVARGEDEHADYDFDAFPRRRRDDDPEHIPIEPDRLARSQRPAPDAPWRPRHVPPPPSAPRGRPRLPAGGASRRPAAPELRGMDLLCENLTPQQRQQLTTYLCFDVTGGDSGRRYRLWLCPLQNIEEFDTRGNRVCVWCFHPREPLVLGDVLLAQKTALELFESEAIHIAHRYSDFASRIRPDLAAACMEQRHMLPDFMAR